MAGGYSSSSHLSHIPSDTPSLIPKHLLKSQIVSLLFITSDSAVNRNLLIILIFIAGIIILPALGCRMPPKLFPATFLTLTLAICQIGTGLHS